MKITTLQPEESNQASDPESDTTQMLELSPREVKIAMITIVKLLKEKVDNMQKQMVMWQQRP